MASDKKSKMPDTSITARLQRFQGRSALATSEMGWVLYTRPNWRSVRTTSDPSKTVSAKRWKFSMIGNATRESRIAWETIVLSHH